MKKSFLFLPVLLFSLLSCHSKENDSLSTFPSSESESSVSSESFDIISSAKIEENNISVSEYSVMKGTSKIVGDLYRQEKTDKTPLIILMHSAFLTGKAMKSYANYFVKKGYTAYAFDFCGGSSSSRSDGKVKDMTIFTEVDDVLAVYQHFSALDYIDTEKIYLLGSSQGGLVASIAASELKDKIKELYLFYPAFNIPEQVKNAAFPGPYGEEFIETLKDYDSYSIMGDYLNSVTIFHGTKDFTVPLRYSEKAASKFPSCVVYPIEGAGHGFNSANYSISGNFDPAIFAIFDKITQD